MDPTQFDFVDDKVYDPHVHGRRSGRFGGFPRGDGSSLEESVAWQGRPSLWLIVEYWVLALFGIGLIVAFWPIISVFAEFFFRKPVNWLYGLGMALVIICLPSYKTLAIYCTLFTLTNQRLVRKTGILSTLTTEIELHRVRDLKVIEPFHLRVLGLGNIYLITRDATHPSLLLEALPHPGPMRDMLRHLVLKRQADIGWRETEVT